MADVKKELVPPDGGWGWVVCFAYALNNIIVLPLITGFGLIFQATFTELGISATNASIIINVNHAFGMLLSLFNGPLLRSFGYRKVATAGALFVAVGILLTSQARSFWHFLITYSLMTSIGVALVMSAFSLAINSFFRKNRGKAMAVGMSITGLGPIFMPQVINGLIGALGTQGAVIVLGALSLHSLVAALLLRPVKWYMKPAEEEVEAGKEKDPDVLGEDGIKTFEMKDMSKSKDSLSENEDDYKEDSLKFKNAVQESLEASHENGLNNTSKKAISSPDVRNSETNGKKTYRWFESSATEINLGSSENIFDENIRSLSYDALARRKSSSNSQRTRLTSPETKTLLPNKTDGNKKSSEIKDGEKVTFGTKIVEFFDLGLLKDPIFVNIMLGISLAACAEINFALLTPFILSDLKFTTPQIAAVLSVIAFSDIIFRFLSPFIGDMCHKSARVMYIISLFMLIFTRTTLFFASSYGAMLAVALGLGVAKGVRSVYMSLVIPNYVPIERLAFASGIQMVTNGIILMTIGPILGLIRDRSGSYNISIICINIITSITIMLWLGEYLYMKYIYVKDKKITT